MRATFEAVIAGGVRVAWIGAEGVPFCDAAQLFDVKHVGRRLGVDDRRRGVRLSAGA